MTFGFVGDVLLVLSKRDSSWEGYIWRRVVWPWSYDVHFRAIAATFFDVGVNTEIP